MAWSWSHSAQAYVYAHDQLEQFSRTELIEILAEWRMFDRHGHNDSAWADQWSVVLRNARKWASTRIKGYLVQEIWERAERQATCDNGDWNAWMCPYGCHPHCVDFGPEDSELHPRVTREEVYA